MTFPPSSRPAGGLLTIDTNLPAAPSFAAEILTLEHSLSDLVNQAYALAAAEIGLMWQTAPPRMPVLPP